MPEHKMKLVVVRARHDLADLVRFGWAGKVGLGRARRDMAGVVRLRVKSQDKNRPLNRAGTRDKL